jgi:TolB-like protein
MTPGRQYAFGRFRLDAEARLLFRDEERIQLTPKAIDVLVTLVESRGAPVRRQDLFREVWSDAVVEDGTLTSHISLLRRMLGEELIETIPKRGYRFVAEVSELQPNAARAEERALLAVLPFENLSGGRKHDSFSDGLTEEMITQLGRLNPARLGIIARTSAMTYKATDKTIEQIGRELGVSYVLEGSVRRAGGRVRITAQLIQVSDQTHLWADNFEGSLEDILALQSRVAIEVARQTRIRLLAPEQNPRSVIPAAYEAYLQGRSLWERRSADELRLAIRCFQEAIQADPGYAPAHAGIADTYLAMMDRGHLSPREATAKARPYTLKALRLDPDLAEAHVSLGHAAFHEFDWPTAESELARGIALNPSASIPHHYYSNYLAAMGKHAEAIAQAEEAKRLDPVSPVAHCNLATILWQAGERERFAEQARKTLELFPTYSRAWEEVGRAHEQSGAFDAAIEAFRRAGSLASLGRAYALSGRTDEAADVLRQLHDAAKTSFVSASDFALIHVALGDRDEAVAWLEKAWEERSSLLPFLRVNPRFATLRDDARFQRLIERLAFPDTVQT